MSSKREGAIRLIANLVGCHPSQLPHLKPIQFAVSSWEWLGMYGGLQDVRDCMMGVWRELGVETVCPKCHMYARRVFFLGNAKYPDAFECDFCHHLFGCAPEEMMADLAKKHNLCYPPKMNKR